MQFSGKRRSLFEQLSKPNSSLNLTVAFWAKKTFSFATPYLHEYLETTYKPPKGPHVFRKVPFEPANLESFEVINRISNLVFSVCSCILHSVKIADIMWIDYKTLRSYKTWHFVSNETIRYPPFPPLQPSYCQVWVITRFFITSYYSANADCKSFTIYKNHTTETPKGILVETFTQNRLKSPGWYSRWLKPCYFAWTFGQSMVYKTKLTTFHFLLCYSITCFGYTWRRSN